MAPKAPDKAPNKPPVDPVLARLATMPVPVRFIYARPRTFIAMAVGLVVALLLPASLRPITRAPSGTSPGGFRPSAGAFLYRRTPKNPQVS